MSNWTLKEKSVGDLEVTIDGEKWTKAVTKAFNKIAKNVTIDGFRKGCAPKALIEKRVGEQERYYQAIDDSANTWMREAMDENKLVPISRPELSIKAADADHAELVFTFAVYPEVNVKDYKGLPYEVKAVEVTDEDVEKELSGMRERYADVETVDGEAASGDTVNIDYEGFKDGVAFDGGKAEGYNLVLGSNSFIPGFEDQLIGAKAGDEKELNLTFPKEYHAEDLAGKDVVFKVKVNEVKRKVLPELDDDFAKDVSIKDVETVEDLRKFLRERLENTRKQEAENAADNELMSKLVECVEADIPDVMIDDEVQGQIQQLQAQLSQYGMSLTSYLQMMGKKPEDLKNDFRADAEKNVKARMALSKIAELEKLEPTDEDVENEYSKLADQYGMKVEDVKKAISADMLKVDVRNSKAYDFVKENAAK